jgi:hypothetical protein
MSGIELCPTACAAWAIPTSPELADSRHAQRKLNKRPDPTPILRQCDRVSRKRRPAPHSGDNRAGDPIQHLDRDYEPGSCITEVPAYPGRHGMAPRDSETAADGHTLPHKGRGFGTSRRLHRRNLTSVRAA